jgi:hypothetical protein
MGFGHDPTAIVEGASQAECVAVATSSTMHHRLSILYLFMINHNHNLL